MILTGSKARYRGKVPRGLKYVIVSVSVAALWLISSVGFSSVPKRQIHVEEADRVIEDALENSLDLQPLPSDVDLHSKQRVIDVIIFAKFAYTRMKIPRQLSSLLQSLMRNTATPLHIHVLTDVGSYVRLRRTFRSVMRANRGPLNFTLYDLEPIEMQFKVSTTLLRKYFYSRVVQKYSDDIFFMTPLFHKIFPAKIQRAIFLDIDLIFKADIADLWAKFAEFTKDNIIGIGHDLQPHYRYEFSKYRDKHKGTDVGEARPGKQGFNTGVMLMDFDRMRNSKLYNELLREELIRSLRDKYEFYGFLGHQDFFTLLGMEYPELFLNLHCSWNRQLDTGMKHYPKEIFDLYHRCEEPIRVYHANGDTIIPAA